jgi:hypothetical protein
MPGEINIITWDDIKQNFIGKKISQLDKVEVASATVKSPPNVSVAGVGLSFGASAKLAINAYNDATDNDDEQVIGTPDAETSEGVLHPKIPFDAQRAWLRYSFIGGLTAEAKAKLQLASVNVDASSQIVFSDYHMHKPADSAEVTVAADLPALRTALSLSDVLALPPGEALYYQIRGDLLFGVKVSWSDIFTKTLSDIASVLPSSKTFAIEIDVSAFASFKITATDDFVLVFWRDRTANQLHVSVRKASTRGTAFGLGLNVIAKFEFPDDITKLASTLLDGVIGEPLSAIDEVLNAATGGTLDPTQKQIFDRLIKVLDLENAIDKIAAAREKLAELPTKLGAAIQQAAETQIGLSWKYEYSRVESTQSIVEAVLTNDQMSALHRSLVAQNVLPLLARAKTSDTDIDPSHDITLTKYLDEQTVVRTGGFGFSLGIGKWFTIGAGDKTKLTIRTRRSLDRKRSMVSYIGARKFSSTFGSVVDEFGFDFAAAMDGWQEEPKAADFDFALALTMSDQDKKASTDDIAQIIDTASLLSIVMDEDVAGISDTLTTIEGHRITARYELKFSEDVLRQIARAAGTRNDEQMARSLAAAMPWQNVFPRSSWRRRMDLYDNAWFGRINKQLTPEQAYKVVEIELIKNHLGAEVAPVAGSLMGELKNNPEVLSDYTRWVNGMSLLADAVGEGTMPHKKIATIFGDLYPYFSRVLYARAIGRRLVEIAAAQGVLSQVGRALVVTQMDENKRPERILNIGSKA